MTRRRNAPPAPEPEWEPEADDSGFPDGVDEGEEFDEGDEGEDEGDEGDYDLGAPPLPTNSYDAELNDPRVVQLPEAPLIGGRGTTRIHGEDVSTIGTPSSPSFWASGARSPDVVRLHVSKVDPTSGSPHSIGAIQSNCTEDGFLRHFFASMPKPGEGVATFQVRPANAHGQEVGSMVIRSFSPHHTTLAQLREEQQAMNNGAPNLWQMGGQNADGVSAVVTELGEQIGTINANMLDFQERQLDNMKDSLEHARQEAREAERKSAEERIALARDSSTLQQTILEKMIASEKERTKETLATQKSGSDFMLQLLTGMSAQTRESLLAESKRREEEDARRGERERQYFDRLHKEDQVRRDRERADQEARWQREREAAKDEQARREKELQTTIELAKLELQNKAKQLEDDAARREKEFELKMKLAADEREARDRREREDRDARDARLKDERDARERAELARLDRERKEEQERRDRERDREEKAREREREEAKEREAIRVEERRRADEARKEAYDLALKRLEDERIRELARLDRESENARQHAERLANTHIADRTAAQLSEERRLKDEREERERRDKAEREDAAARERDRERAHKAEMERLERQHQQAQAHETRMFELQKLQATGGDGGGSAIEKLGDLAKSFGVEPTDALRKIFTAEDGMTEQLFKGLGAVFQGWMQAQASRPPAPAVTVTQPAPRQMVTIQTPEGQRQITVDEFRALQSQGQVAPRPTLPGVPGFTPPPLPPQPAPERTSEGAPAAPAPVDAQPAPTPVETTPAEPQAPAPIPPEYLAAKEVNVLTRSREGGLATKAARDLRKLAKAMVQRLEAASPSEWEGILGETLTGRLDFLEYLTAVTVWAAVVDAGAPPALAEQIVSFVRQAELSMRTAFGRTEPMLPFTEEDLVAFRARTVSPTPPPLTPTPVSPEVAS